MHKEGDLKVGMKQLAICKWNEDNMYRVSNGMKENDI